MPVPTIGDRVKVVERAVTGDTKVVTEGVVAAVDEANNRLDFQGFGRTKLADTANVNVRLEIVAPPLPTTPGSVLRVTKAGFAPVTVLLQQVGWYDENDSAWTPGRIQEAGYEVVFDAGA